VSVWSTLALIAVVALVILSIAKLVVATVDLLVAVFIHSPDERAEMHSTVTTRKERRP
jgi:hypothetical protein